MNNLDTIVQVKLPSGQVVDIVDWSDLPIFSSADLQNGYVQEEVDLFQYVAGRDVASFGAPGAAVVKRTASDLDTNVATAGQMTTNEELLVYAIKPEYFFFITEEINDFNSRSLTLPGSAGFPSPSAAGLAVLQQQLLLRLIISEKVFAEAGLGYFNTGFGVFQQTTVQPGAAAAVGIVGTATAGLPSQEAVRSYVLPHHIGAQEKYRAQLINPNGDPVLFGMTEQFGGEGGDRVVNPDVMCTIRINLDGLYKRPTA
jgi:hypothetical protein